MRTSVPDLRVTVALEAAATLGEGPFWDERTGILWWVDILKHTVHRFDPRSGQDRQWQLPAPVGAAVPREGGGLVLALGRGFGFLDEHSGELTELASVSTGERMNDAACDPAGRLLAGTMADEETPGAAALYALEPDGGVREILDQVTLSNGLAWSRDGKRLYYVDTPLCRIDVFDYDVVSGALSGRRTAVDLAEVPGRPDGLTLDVEENLWVAMARGGQVRCYATDGALLHAITIPAPVVTSLTFGGSDLDELYVTTGRWSASAEDLDRYPDAGAIFRIRGIPVPGTPAHRFAG